MRLGLVREEVAVTEIFWIAPNHARRSPLPSGGDFATLDVSGYRSLEVDRAALEVSGVTGEPLTKSEG